MDYEVDSKNNDKQMPLLYLRGILLTVLLLLSGALKYIPEKQQSKTSRLQYKLDSHISFLCQISF